MSFAIPINTRVSDDGLLSIVRRTKIIRNMNCSTMMIYSILVVDTMLPKYMNDYFLSLSPSNIYKFDTIAFTNVVVCFVTHWARKF